MKFSLRRILIGRIVAIGEILSQPNNVELEARIKELNNEIQRNETRLQALRSGVSKVDPKIKTIVEKALGLYSKEWKNRKRIVEIHVKVLDLLILILV